MRRGTRTWVVTVALTVPACGGTGSMDEAGTSSDCSMVLVVEGRVYDLDTYNDGPLGPAALGDSIGSIEHQYPCEAATPDGLAAGIWSLGSSVGSDVRRVSGHADDAVLAAVDADMVRVYRARDVDPLTSVVAGDVQAIGVNSDVDGTTRFATIDDPSTVSELVALVVAGVPSDDEPDLTGIRHVIEFVRSDGFVTVVPYWVGDSLLGDRRMDDAWSAAIEAALANSPDQPDVAGLTLAGERGAATVHALGGCRHDRVDLEVRPGETLTADVEHDVLVTWFLDTPRPPPSPEIEQVEAGPSMVVPEFAGTLILEVGLTEDAGVATLGHFCATLRSGG